MNAKNIYLVKRFDVLRGIVVQVYGPYTEIGAKRKAAKSGRYIQYQAQNHTEARAKYMYAHPNVFSDGLLKYLWSFDIWIPGHGMHNLADSISGAGDKYCVDFMFEGIHENQSISST